MVGVVPWTRLGFLIVAAITTAKPYKQTHFQSHHYVLAIVRSNVALHGVMEKILMRLPICLTGWGSSCVSAGAPGHW